MLGRIFVAADGRLRSGWALLVFWGVLGLGWGLVQQLLFRPQALAGTLGTPWALPPAFGRVAAALFATWVGCLLVRQPLRDAGYAPRRAGRLLVLGLVLGGSAVSSAVGVAVLAGQERFAFSGAGLAALARDGAIELLAFVGFSVAEEIATRGFMLQQLARAFGWPARRWGVAAAVVVTGGMFGFAHGGNPNVSRVAVLNIVLIGLWFGALVVRTGSLWVTFGAHTAWNVVEGVLWGEPVSGFDAGTAILRREWFGAELWTGGSFGTEGSLVTSVVVAVLLVGTLVLPPARRV